MCGAEPWIPTAAEPLRRGRAAEVARVDVSEKLDEDASRADRDGRPRPLPNLDDEVVTVRPADPVETVQRLPNFVGISGATSGARGIGMNIVVIPPGAAAEAHFHDGFETAIYLLAGVVETRYGDHLAHSTINRAGDFLFIPAGVPHQPRNLSATEPARALVARNTPAEQESVVPYRPA
jgi:uncharacterized RmlC-like cupin family protein